MMVAFFTIVAGLLGLSKLMDRSADNELKKQNPPPAPPIPPAPLHPWQVLFITVGSIYIVVFWLLSAN